MQEQARKLKLAGRLARHEPRGHPVVTPLSTTTRSLEIAAAPGDVRFYYRSRRCDDDAHCPDALQYTRTRFALHSLTHSLFCPRIATRPQRTPLTQRPQNAHRTPAFNRRAMHARTQHTYASLCVHTTRPVLIGARTVPITTTTTTTTAWCVGP